MAVLLWYLVLLAFSGCTALTVLFCLFPSGYPVEPVMFWLSFGLHCLDVHFWHSCLGSPALAVWSWGFCFDNSVFAVLSWQPCPNSSFRGSPARVSSSGSPVLAILFFLSTSTCPVILVPSCLSGHAWPVLAVLSCLYFPELSVYERARTSMRVHAWVRVRVGTCTYMCVGVCCISRYTVTRHESAKGTGSTKIRGRKTRCMIARNKSGHFKEKTLQ